MMSSDLGSQCAIVFPDDLSHQQIDWFWSQDVCMDDWDYMVIVPAESLESGTRECQVWDDDKCDLVSATEEYWEPKNYTLSAMLQGCCNNKWYIVEFDDGRKGVGIAYHS